jgi:Putative SAM-dependent methyltransferase
MTHKKKMPKEVRFFKLLQSVLAKRMEYVRTHEKLTQKQVLHLILDEAENNHEQWFSNDVPNLNYHLPACRLAYLYIVAAANATTFKWILKNNTDLNQHVLGIAKNKQQLNVCAFGAGPGTELMAFAKFFSEAKLEHSVQVEFQLLDIEQGWQDSWYGIRDAIKDHFRAEYGNNCSAWPMIPSGNFTCQDVKDTKGMENLGDIWSHDVFVINFVLSELFNDEPGFRAFISAVTNRAPQGSRFVFIERRGSRWEKQMANCAKEAGLHLSPFKERSGGMDSGDDADLLGDVYQQLSSVPEKGKNPRNSWNVVYSIGVKE